MTLYHIGVVLEEVLQAREGLALWHHLVEVVWDRDSVLEAAKVPAQAVGQGEGETGASI